MKKRNWVSQSLVMGSALASVMTVNATDAHAAFSTPSGDKSGWEEVKSGFPKSGSESKSASLADVEDLRKQLALLQKKVSQQAAQIQTLQSSDSQQSNDIAVLKSSLNSQIARIDDLDSDVLSLLEKTQYLTLEQTGSYPEMRILGANLRLVNGMNCSSSDSESDACSNGTGNLILGYNGLSASGLTVTGSHNLVITPNGSYSGNSSFVGGMNSGSWGFAAHNLSGASSAVYSNSVVVSGYRNEAQNQSAVLGGSGNTAIGSYSTVSGGSENFASGAYSAVVGGAVNRASGRISALLGGYSNTASGTYSAVAGGDRNTASGQMSTVSGGANRTSSGNQDWSAGSLFETN